MQKQTDYIGNYIYENGKLSFILTDKGRIVPDSSGFAYEYFIKDHLGNTRVTVEDSSSAAAVMSEAHYYPFGLQISELSFNKTQPKNKYLYNGKELQEDFGLGWYDYGKRFYDAEVPRFTSIDPLAEKYYSISPYAYVADNPIRFIDPNGEDIWISYSEQQARRDKEGNVKTYKRGKRKGQVKYKTVYKSVQYHENGTLTNKDGSVYEGNNSFILKVAGALTHLNKNLKNMGGENSDIISNMVNNSEFKVNIIKSEQTRQNGRARDVNYSQSYNIEWNPHLGGITVHINPETGINRQTPVIALLHEIDHADYAIKVFQKRVEASRDEENRCANGIEQRYSKYYGFGWRENYYDDLIDTYNAKDEYSIEGN